MKYVVVFFFACGALATLSAASRLVQIVRRDSDGSYLVKVGPENEAYYASGLASVGWKTVAINGQYVDIVLPNCATITKPKIALSLLERMLIKTTELSESAAAAASRPLPLPPTNRKPADKTSVSVIELRDGLDLPASFNHASESQFSFARKGLPLNVGMMALEGDLVTMVRNDGRVSMRPLACLNSAERRLLGQVHAELHQAINCVHQKMNANMDFLQSQLKESMMRMHEDMSNMLFT